MKPYDVWSLRTGSSKASAHWGLAWPPPRSPAEAAEAKAWDKLILKIIVEPKKDFLTPTLGSLQSSGSLPRFLNQLPESHHFTACIFCQRPDTRPMRISRAFITKIECLPQDRY
jgi:hypothetical protein